MPGPDSAPHSLSPIILPTISEIGAIKIIAEGNGVAGKALYPSPVCLNVGYEISFCEDVFPSLKCTRKNFQSPETLLSITLVLHEIESA